MKSSIGTDVEATDAGVGAVEIRLGRRTDALALMVDLIPFHSFLVQHDREHWVVHARVPGCHGETLDDLLSTIERSGSDIGPNDLTCVVGDRYGGIRAGAPGA
jgi:hypothetical protein